MSPKLSAFAEIIAKANDALMAKHQRVDTLMGIIDKALRQQGMAADAITIDAPSLDKKVVFLLADVEPEHVEVAYGNKAGDIFRKARVELTSLDVEQVQEMMEGYFFSH
ncbi:hypothetical protein DXX93_12500 [Thalassotalea euphylliae]|uniref:Uncharacterized protein n=1 Tax=Thalassotalea euphylliae TaxID=1655234 RepID=A0A3E0TTJ9_9GAMM|nr:hypothetical protein [Thalassotalea euphylliae]REL27302.1 hypothetical protein DXX93_12500 [Thalassotalea euphylliae]